MEKKKILVVDDEKGFTAMLQLNLESKGEFDVRVENNSLNAIDAIEEFNPDLILLDVIMPQREGPEIAKEIKESENFGTIPIIFLTATISEFEKQNNQQTLDGCLLIPKPSSLQTLLRSINLSLN